MEKTVIVEIKRKRIHPKYKKEVVRKTRVYAHTEDPIEVGTKVTVEESKPLSKTKRWKVISVDNQKK